MRARTFSILCLFSFVIAAHAATSERDARSDQVDLPYRVSEVVDPLERAAEIARLEALPVAVAQESAATGSTLGDIVDSLATSAGMSYFALPDGDLRKTPCTFKMTDNAWGALKMLSLKYNFDMVFAETTKGRPVWMFTPVRPEELITRTFVMRHNTHEVTQASSSGGFGGGSSGSLGSSGAQGGSQGALGSSSGGGTSGSMTSGGSSSEFTTTNPLTQDLVDLLAKDESVKGTYVKWISDTNTFVVRANSRQLHDIEDLLAREDQDLPEITLDFTFVLASDSPTEKEGVSSTLLSNGLGMSATGLSASVNLNHVSGTSLPTTTVAINDLTATLNLLKQNTRSYSVLVGSSTILSNRDGSIQSVEMLPIQQNTLAAIGTSSSNTGGVTTGTITYNPVGDSIHFHAKELDGHEVQLSLDIEVSSVTSTQNVGGQNVPIVGQQSYNSEAIIEEGQSLGMGGLEGTINTVALSKVPGIGDVPFFGFPFKNFERDVARSRLYLFITPHVLRRHSGAEFNGNRTLTPVVANEPRQPFQAQAGLGLADVARSLDAIPADLESLELAVKSGRGDDRARRDAKLLVNELDLMQVTVDENRLKGVVDADQDTRLKALRARAAALAKASDLPDL